MEKPQVRERQACEKHAEALKTEPRRRLQLLGVLWEVRLERQMERGLMTQPPVNRATAYFCSADQVVMDGECLLAHSRSAVSVILKIIYPKKNTHTKNRLALDFILFAKTVRKNNPILCLIILAECREWLLLE